MKNSSKAKKHHGKQPISPQSIALHQAEPSLMRWVVPVLSLLLACGGTWAVFEFVIWNTMPPELVGKWVVTEGPQEGATFDFFRNGTMLGRVNVQGQLAFVNATIRMEGKNLYFITRHPKTGREDTRVQLIRNLTANAMVWEDAQGILLKLERAE